MIDLTDDICSTFLTNVIIERYSGDVGHWAIIIRDDCFIIYHWGEYGKTRNVIVSYRGKRHTYTKSEFDRILDNILVRRPMDIPGTDHIIHTVDGNGWSIEAGKKKRHIYIDYELLWQIRLLL